MLKGPRCSNKSQAQLVREAVPFVLAPLILFGVFEYLTPFVERTVRHTPLAAANRPVDAKETAWKVELANRRAMRIHEELETIKTHIGATSNPADQVRSLPEQIEQLRDNVASLTAQLEQLQQRAQATDSASDTNKD